MSVTRSVDTEFRDPIVMELAAKELSAEFKVGEYVDGAIKPFPARMWNREPIQAVMSVHLPGWKYPIAVDSEGKTYFDNHDGAWGSEALLDQLRQNYAVNYVKQRAGQQRLRVTSQQTQADGTIRLVLA